MHAIVCQSYRERNVPGWARVCMDSVEAWTRAQGWEYHFIGDDIVDLIPKGYQAKADGNWPVLSEYGRLALLSKLLSQGYSYVVWLDADVLVFNPAALSLPTDVPYAFGREVWVRRGDDGGLAVRRHIHNAAMIFRAGNPVLEFYRHAVARAMMHRPVGDLDPLAGPKLLGALNGLVGFPLIDAVGVFSPPVLHDVAAGGGAALDLLVKETPVPLAAANLHASLLGADTDATLDAVCARLLKNPGILG